MANVIVMPKLGLTMSSGTILSWSKREGDHIEKGEVILEIETDKIVSEVESPHTGTLLKILAEEGSELPVQAPLALIGEKGEDISEHLSAHESADSDDREPASAGGPAIAAADTVRPYSTRTERRMITPRARQLIKQYGIPLDRLEGMTGRITESDIRELLSKSGEESRHDQVPTGPAPPSHAEKVIAQRMVESAQIPQFSLRFRAEMDHALSLMDQISASTGTKVTLNSLFLRAVAMSLSRHPEVLRHYRGEFFYQPTNVNVGFAVESENSIIVPVIRDADKKRIGEIAEDASRFIEQARGGRILPDDVSGGVITVSNLGMFGAISFVPLLIPGQSSIIGIGAVQKTVRVEDGVAVSGHAVEITLVCDHRSVNGASGAAFCQELVKTIETAGEPEW